MASALLEFGNATPLTALEMESLRLASGENDPRANRHRRLSEKSRELQARAEVLQGALALVIASVDEAKKAAQLALAPAVFRDTYRPALKHAGEALVAAVVAMKSVRELATRIDTAELLTGPNAGSPLPLYLLDTFLKPGELLDALVHASVFDAATAAQMRARLSSND